VPNTVIFALCVVLGVATGVFSAIFGVGGAVISTPGIRALGATPIEGVGSTLPSVLPSAIVGAARYHREGLVRWNIVAMVAPWGCLAAVGGAIASVHFPGKGHVQMLLTAGLILYTAFSVSRARPAAPSSTEPLTTGGTATITNARVDRHVTLQCALIGLGAGALSGFLGVGGGILMTPTFRGWLRLPLKVTVATSLACVGLIAIPSSLTHMAEGTVNWLYALPLCIGVIPGARLGAHFAIAASDHRLRLMFGWVLGIIGIAYATVELIALIH
jgi:uncharacterized membrane protein YfcA